MIPCGCGHDQTEDGWCEIPDGNDLHEVHHRGRECRLCGKDVFAELPEAAQ